MYRLCIYDSNDDLVCLVHGSLDDICFLIDNIKFAITYRFKITEV